MLTTDTPGAQEFSIARSAAMPPRGAPYPTDVGTAMPGRSTRPPMTLGLAPSIPPTAPATFSGRLARDRPRLGGAAAKGGGVLPFAKGQVLVGRAPQARHRRRHVEAAGLDVLEELPDRLPIPRPPSRRGPGADSRSPTGTPRGPRPRRGTRARGSASRSPRRARPARRAPAQPPRPRRAPAGRGGGRGTGGSRASARTPRPRPPA